MPAIKGYWRKGMNRADAPYLPLTPEVVDAHRRGETHIGLYPLSDDDTSWWVAADFDKEAAMAHAKSITALRLLRLKAKHETMTTPNDATIGRLWRR